MHDRGRHHSRTSRWRDPRPPAQVSHDVRAAVLRALRAGAADPTTIAAAARAALTAQLPHQLQALPFPGRPDLWSPTAQAVGAHDVHLAHLG